VNRSGGTSNTHDILTGSTADGRAYTGAADHACSSYTSSVNVEAPAAGAPAQGAAPEPSGQLGHHDRRGGGNASWNWAHASRGCRHTNLVCTRGGGSSTASSPIRVRNRHVAPHRQDGH
jgi:hypothetical protein